MKTKQVDGFHLDIEDYLMGVLQLASELSRFATNAGNFNCFYEQNSLTMKIFDVKT